MKNTSPAAARLTELIQARNRELAQDAALKVGLGVIFTLITFSVLWWMGWVFGYLVAGMIGLAPWLFGVIITSIFFVVSVWSAWTRVDPLAEVEPPTADELFSRSVANAAGLSYFSPRHATAGAAVVLLGGPASIFHGLGIWTHRIRIDDQLFKEAARLLESCRKELPSYEVRDLAAAFLLRRLALVKVVPHGEETALALTEKGRGIVGEKKKAPAEPPRKVRRGEKDAEPT